MKINVNSRRKDEGWIIIFVLILVIVMAVVVYELIVWARRIPPVVENPAWSSAIVSGTMNVPIGATGNDEQIPNDYNPTLDEFQSVGFTVWHRLIDTNWILADTLSLATSTNGVMSYFVACYLPGNRPDDTNWFNPYPIYDGLNVSEFRLQLQGSTNLVDWYNIDEPVINTLFDCSPFTVPISDAQFLRMEVTVPSPE